MKTPLEKILRITTAQKNALKKLGIITIGDLLFFFPVRYSDISQVKLIRDIAKGEVVTLYGKLGKLQLRRGFKSRIPMTEAILTDMVGNALKIIWFHQPYLAKMFHEGQTVKLTGTVSESKYGLALTNPEIEHAPDLPIDSHSSLFSDSQHMRVGYPIYRETRGITSKWFYHAIEKILTPDILNQIEDPLPSYILEKYHLPVLRTALVWIHKPQKESDAISARKRFSFQEIFLIQLKKQQSRHIYEEHYAHDISIDHALLEEFIHYLPFSLTDGQRNAIDTIVHDLDSDKPMSRLLEGDVGSGKTAIAAAITHTIIINRPRKQSYGNLQVAYMAPTEVLATQLFENFIQYFKNSGIQIALMTGSGCRKYPSKVNSSGWTTISAIQVKKWITNGEIPIVIGTHALIQKSIKFKDLALVIIDEQHRFGTKQRMELVHKHGTTPHYLSMTATPIPRTLALTIYGDLDLSVLDSMPPGRKPVITKIVPPTKRNEIYDAIREELKRGRQLYVICPRIVSPDDAQPMTETEWNFLSPQKQMALRMKSVATETKRLQKEIFPEYRIDSIHSKMSKDAKEKTMKKFSEYKTDILVATSVIEVGVNVPNTTMIIIEGAERYGLAQLHQLRGRVIRSEHQAYCWLFTSSSSPTTADRLKAFMKAKNGFELAELDLALRGTGDLAGIKQWGLSDLGMEAIKNLKMVEAARAEAKHIITNDPRLDNSPELSNIIKHEKFQVHFE
ncbi:hypothetical protein A2997_00785 [Candidatus Nomurabacteria bacterium RIFCSPLOWO2_01_FULL_36_10b]|uniref:Probable DNA 3'-5' helicase RecG n=1 Tax=Candidatus Nomurabacteria bacterium RIFCSPLOWO2_01_FULL_36_10b TaxID=1801766 RepID=A0A1F6WQE8_9BACT|nr:MAG: hypothetical protein A2997_00785 [Candidatus Nomurabacteria bacterium RIFCSPLOWO2_01_FULL_36_10b]